MTGSTSFIVLWPLGNEPMPHEQVDRHLWRTKSNITDAAPAQGRFSELPTQREVRAANKKAKPERWTIVRSTCAICTRKLRPFEVKKRAKRCQKCLREGGR